MKIGFDYWNCVSHYPEHFRWIMGAFENYAVETHIISAIGKGRIGTIADEVQALPGWGGFNPKWYETSVHEVVLKIAILYLIGYTVGAIVIKRKGDDDQL